MRVTFDSAGFETLNVVSLLHKTVVQKDVYFYTAQYTNARHKTKYF